MPSSSSPRPEPERIYYSAVYHCRRTSALLFGLIFLVASLFGLYFMIKNWFSVPASFWTRASDVFAIGIAGLMAVAGGWVVRNYLLHQSYTLQIDTNGVSYAGRHFPWEDIDSLSAHKDGSKLQLGLNKRGRFVLDRCLPTDDGFTEDEFDKLMDELSQQLSRIHPHLNLG